MPEARKTGRIIMRPMARWPMPAQIIANLAMMMTFVAMVLSPIIVGLWAY